jgi:hypothetical protein
MKLTRLTTTIIAAIALVAANSGLAQETTSNAVAEVTIRGGGTYANSSSATLLAGNSGVLEVKSGSSTGTGTRKSYVQFDVGANPNTNANATFTFPLSGTPPSQAIRVILWALNQAAPTLGPSTTWNMAQANWTNTDYLWVSTPTNGTTATATPISTNLIPTYNNPNAMTYSYTLAGGANGWGQFVRSAGGSNTVAFGLTGVYDASYNGSPVRVPSQCCFSGTLPLPGYWNPCSLTFWQKIGAGDMPSISLCTNVTTYPTLNSPTNYFTVSPSGLTPTATSDNQTAVADADIHISGSGANWSIYVAGGASPGSANIKVTISDGAGNPANANFKVTVNPVEPFFSIKPSETNTLTGIEITVPFSVYEPTSNADNITIWATSLNANVVPNSGLSTAKVAGTGGTNRTVTITPLAGTNGLVPIALWASDGSSSNRVAFAVQVRPSAKVAFFDAFAYTTNLTSGRNDTLTNGVGRLDLASGSFWQVRAGTTPPIFVTDGQAQVTYPLTATTPQSLVAPLFGGPYLAGKDAIIYTTFKATWTALPVDSGTTLSLYDPNASGTVGLVARITTVVTNASSVPGPAPGTFRVGVANGEGTAGTTNYIDYPLDLSVGSSYTIATRYVVDAAKTTLWVANYGSPLSEADFGTLAQDTHTARPVYSIGLRQGTDTGPVLIDDLKVTVVTRPSFVSVTQAGAYVIIVFAAGVDDSPSDFIVNGTASLPTPLAPLNPPIGSLGGGLFQAVVPMVGNQGYYQLARKPMVFP